MAVSPEITTEPVPDGSDSRVPHSHSVNNKRLHVSQTRLAELGGDIKEAMTNSNIRDSQAIQERQVASKPSDLPDWVLNSSDENISSEKSSPYATSSDRLGEIRQSLTAAQTERQSRLENVADTQIPDWLTRKNNTKQTKEDISEETSLEKEKKKNITEVLNEKKVERERKYKTYREHMTGWQKTQRALTIARLGVTGISSPEKLLEAFEKNNINFLTNPSDFYRSLRKNDTLQDIRFLHNAQFGKDKSRGVLPKGIDQASYFGFHIDPVSLGPLSAGAILLENFKLVDDEAHALLLSELNEYPFLAEENLIEEKNISLLGYSHPLVSSWRNVLQQGISNHEKQEVMGVLVNTLQKPPKEVSQQIKDNLISYITSSSLPEKEKKFWGKAIPLYRQDQPDFYQYLISEKDKFINLPFEKFTSELQQVQEIFTAINDSPSQEIQEMKQELLDGIFDSENPTKAYEKIETIFLRNNLPLVGKIFLTFKTLYSP